MLAENHLIALEKKLEIKPEVKTQHRDFINEYLQLSHMVLNDGNNGSAYYMPHHCVIKDSYTTKLCILFDAFSTTTAGYSLKIKVQPCKTLFFQS